MKADEKAGWKGAESAALMPMINLVPRGVTHTTFYHFPAEETQAS